MTVLLTLCFKLIYEIIKKTCHRAYHHYGFAVTHALWHIWGAWIATKASQWQPWDHIVFMILYNITHCVKSVHIRSYSGPHFSRIFPHLDWLRRDIFSPNAGKIPTRITLNTYTFYAVTLYCFCKIWALCL